MQIYTNAPEGYDNPGTEGIGELADLRIVWCESLNAGLEQLIRYKEGGFFTTLHRIDALGFVRGREWKGQQPDPPFVELPREIENDRTLSA